MYPNYASGDEETALISAPPTYDGQVFPSFTANEITRQDNNTAYDGEIITTLDTSQE